ncbi:hypothetical protein HMN09_00835000 [Mycena chlorophos]|uniref:3'-5' exonuclease domain-containing protein n=1 Tax=Mycena chlorophos TaxID=658473 RepID=A0A8H6STZ2_MYCCL|nr:hypothetical protein HMN09_00835000 [Mycena chlorophos]
MRPSSPAFVSTTTVKKHGGARPGAGRPRGSKNKPKHVACAPGAPAPMQSSSVPTSGSSPSTSAPRVPIPFRPAITQPNGTGLANWWSSRAGQHAAPTPFKAWPVPSNQPTPMPLSETLDRIDSELQVLAHDDPTFDPPDRVFDETVEDNPPVLEGVDGDEEDEEDGGDEGALDEEGRAAEAPSESTHEQWLKASLELIQKDTDVGRKPECYRNGQLWIRPRDPIFALEHAGLHNFSPKELYQLPIFVWLPNFLPGHPSEFKCECGGQLNKHGFNSNPIARRVGTTSGEDYFLLTNRFWCSSRRINTDGCGKVYQGTDPWIQAQLPRYVQARFPVSISHRAALDNQQMDMMKITFAGRFGAGPFSRMVRELKMLRHTQVPDFSEFSNRDEYGGFVPSIKYLKSMFIAWFGAHRIYHDRIMSSLSARILKADHTYKASSVAIVDHQGRLPGGERIHEAMYSAVNENEEVRAYALTLTQSFPPLTGFYQRMQTELVRHGHKPTQLMYTDRPKHERPWLEKNIPSLTTDVTHIIRDRFRHLPEFILPHPNPLQHSDSPPEINSICNDILEGLMEVAPNTPLVLVLDAKSDAGAVHILSIRCEKGLFVFNASFVSSPNHVPPCLRSVLTNPDIIKVGYRVRESMRAISQAWDLDSSKCRLVDLGQLAKLKGKLSNHSSSLQSLCGIILKSRLPEMTRTTWDGEVDARDILACGRDVECAWRLWGILMLSGSTGLPLQEADMQPGQLVTLVLQQRAVANGELVEHDGWLEVPDAERIKITPAYSVVRLTEILIPGCPIAKHRQTLQWLHEHNQHIAVQTRTLRTRASDPPQEGDEPLTLPNIPDTSEIPSEVPVAPQHATAEPQMHDADESDLDFDDEEPSVDQLEMELFGDLQHGREMLRQSDAASNIPSRVLDDVYHCMDRLLRLVSKKHSAYREFAHQLSETIFVRDQGDERRVKAKLAERGIDYEYAKRAKKSSLRRRIRNYVPPGQKLSRDLRALFFAYQDLEDASDRSAGRGKFFSKPARRQGAITAESADLGFVSDPPNIPLMRGTNSVEGGVHMIIRRVFGSLHASMELTEAILGNWFNRRNRRIGYYNRTGKRWNNHFDIWLLDDIVEAAIEVGARPTFPQPQLLVTRIATSETFGILPITPEIAQETGIRILPTTNTLSVTHGADTYMTALLRFATKPTNLYRYLQIRQRTTAAVVPIHTQPEFVLFKRIISSFISSSVAPTATADEVCKATDYSALALHWNREVLTQSPTVLKAAERIYFKLPEHLMRHHKKTLQWQDSRATLTLGANTAALRPINTLLNDPKRVAAVLPAITHEPLEVEFQRDATTGLDLDSFNPMALRGQRTAAYAAALDAQVISNEPTPASQPIAAGPSRALTAGPQSAVAGPSRLPIAGASILANQAIPQPFVVNLGADHGDYSTMERARPAKKLNTGKGGRRCVPCVFAGCPSAATCPGRGNRNLCMHKTEPAHAAAGLDSHTRKRARDKPK